MLSARNLPVVPFCFPGMRSFRQWLLRVLLATVLLVAGLAGLAFVPAVQTWLVERILASHSRLDLHLGRAVLAPGHLRLEDLELRTRGLSLRAPRVEAELSILGLMQGRLDCRSLQAEGIHLQYNAPQTEAAGSMVGIMPALLGGQVLEGTPAGASGLQLVELGRIHLTGDLRAAFSSGHSPSDFKLVLEGGGLGQGKAGHLILGIDSHSVSQPALSQLSGQFGLTLSLDVDGRLTRLAAAGGLAAEGGLLKVPARLGLDGLVEGRAGERLLRLQLGQGKRQMASINGNWTVPSGGFIGEWTVDLKDADLEPFLPAGLIPQFELLGGGTLAATPSARHLQVAGRLQGGLDRLDRLGGDWPGLGRFSLNSEFDFEHSGSQLLVRALSLRLASGETLLELRSERPFSADLPSLALVHQSEQGRLLSASCAGVPSTWIQRFLPRISLEGGALGGGFALECREDGWSVTSLSPMEGRGLSLAVDGAPLLREVDASLEMRLDVLAGGWQVELSKLRLRGGDAILLDGILRLGRLSAPGSPLVSMGRCELDLSSCSRQPACDWLVPLSKGHASLEFQFSSSDRLEGHGLLRAEELGTEALPVGSIPRIALEIGLRREPDGTLRIEAPLRLDGPGESHFSELQLEGTILPGAVHHIDFSVTGNRLFADQLRPLFGGLLQAPAHSVLPSGSHSPWTGLEGTLRFNLVQFIVDGQRGLEALSGRLGLTANELVFAEFKARQRPGGGGLQFDGKLSWNEGRFDLEAGFSAESLDTAFLMQLSGAPAWNGFCARFDARGTLRSSDTQWDSLLSSSVVQAELLSKGGTCRLLATDLESFINKKPSGSSGITSSIGALLGMRSHDQSKDSAKQDGPSRMALDLADYFAQIPFDQLTFSLVRGRDGTLQFQDISLIAPLLRVSGTGSILAQEGMPLLSRPMDLRLALLVRGRFSEVLGKAGQLDGTQDPLGYNGYAEGLRVGGSLAVPDTSDLRNRLLKLSFSKSSDDFFRRLLGGR